MTAGVLDAAIGPAVERGDCEHTAILLQSADELPAVLASFYRLGRSRNGWLAHGSLPHEADADRRRITQAGVDVASLESAGSMAFVELDLTVSPEEFVEPWSKLLGEKLRAGFDAMWFARFPIGPSDDEVADVLPFEAAWMNSFRGQRVVTLCPYIVGGLGRRQRSKHRTQVAAVHHQVI